MAGREGYTSLTPVSNVPFKKKKKSLKIKVNLLPFQKESDRLSLFCTMRAKELERIDEDEVKEMA